MPTKTTPQAVPPHTHHDAGAHHYSEIARITTGLFVGVLALMTFLLTAGLQHPQPLFSWFIYISLVALPLNLIIFTIAHSVQQSTATPDTTATGWTGLRIIRLIQQIVFALSIIAITGLALVSAHIFFSPPPAASQQQTQQAQPQ